MKKKGPKKGGRPFEVLTRITKDKEKKTRYEWAAEFNIPVSHMDVIFTKLRRVYGFDIQAVGTKWVNGVPVRGIMKLVTENKEDYRDAEARLHRTQVQPIIEGSFQRLHNYWKKDPKRYIESELRANEVQRLVVENRQKFLSDVAAQQKNEESRSSN